MIQPQIGCYLNSSKDSSFLDQLHGNRKYTNAYATMVCMEGRVSLPKFVPRN
ncbi:hypothetical protein Halhy_4077 [Haliscomenobacter hydrossis DSM 1100]|uniref:Uncharacterized protein n=1 Tax=Haliscomenobacter hydrossis (strain ATCC 27775 / DSM 1100 / LMG 10767 / O) TaxID=760192 RepID=F4L6X0_HALH1|nr:hypothetical protein Halhy_4077 [Haliscomenobacter hydrossis DSM 1100]